MSGASIDPLFACSDREIGPRSQLDRSIASAAHDAAQYLSCQVSSGEVVREHELQVALQRTLPAAPDLEFGGPLETCGVGSTRVSRTPTMRGFAPKGIPDADLSPRLLRGSGVDIVLARDRAWVAMLELKCARAPNERRTTIRDEALAACLWDLAKLGCALTEGLAPFAYLIAAGPRVAFDPQIPGSAPFRCASWSIDAPTLLTHPRVMGWWDKWRRDVSVRPRLIPETLATELVAFFEGGGSAPDFAIAIARVGVPGPCLRLVTDAGVPEALL